MEQRHGFSRRTLLALLVQVLLLSQTSASYPEGSTQGQHGESSSHRRLACEAHEELCPVRPGSKEYHCVDVSDPKTCGGCPSSGTGVDCTAIPGVFMQECTNRGQCTGCRWKRGGLKASLLEPDYLTCSVISTHPPKEPRAHTKRSPQLTFARLVEKANEKPKPMAAKRLSDAYAMERPGEERGGRRKQADAAGPLDFDDPSLLPQPPSWLVAFIRSNKDTLPIETDDKELLWWFESYKKPLLRIATLPENAYQHLNKYGQNRKKTNSERLALGLPPLAPKDLNRPNKPAPWKLGVQLGLVDPAEGETRGDGSYRKKPLEQTEEQRVWSEIAQAAVRFSEKKEAVKVPVMEALWDLVDYVTTGAARTGAWPMAPPKVPPKPKPPIFNPKEMLLLQDTPAGKILRPVLMDVPPKKANPKPVALDNEAAIADVRAAGQAARKAAGNVALTRPQTDKEKKAAAAAVQKPEAQVPIPKQAPIEPHARDVGRGKPVPGRRPAPIVRGAKDAKPVENARGAAAAGPVPPVRDAFEEHLRMANQENARAKALADPDHPPLVQPEHDLLDLYEAEARGKKKDGGGLKPLMANMAKARPNAHNRIPALLRNADRGKRRL